MEVGPPTKNKKDNERLQDPPRSPSGENLQGVGIENSSDIPNDNNEDKKLPEPGLEDVEEGHFVDSLYPDNATSLAPMDPRLLTPESQNNPIIQENTPSTQIPDFKSFSKLDASSKLPILYLPRRISDQIIYNAKLHQRETGVVVIGYRWNDPQSNQL